MGQFQTTSWSLVIAAGQQPTESAEAALAKLCQLYWYPVYAFVRRRGNSQDDARDLTQEFFSRLLEKNYLKDADPERGRFRSFLLAAVRHFLANEWNRGQAQKRGGGMLTIALDPGTAEGRYSLEPANQETPESLYERQWAVALLDQVMAGLRQEYASDGRLDHFERLAPYLTGTGELPYAAPNVYGLMKMKTSQDPQPPTAHVPDLDPHLQEIILHAIERIPRNRYETVAEMLEDLRDPSRVKVTDRALKLHPSSLRAQQVRRAAGIALFFVSLIGAFLALIWMANRYPASPSRPHSGAYRGRR